MGCGRRLDRDRLLPCVPHEKTLNRFLDCTRAVLAHAGKKTAHEIFGAPDDLKFRSCMTLFLLAAPQIDVFRSALDTFYGGEADEHTVRLVGADR